VSSLRFSMICFCAALALSACGGGGGNSNGGNNGGGGGNGGGGSTALTITTLSTLPSTLQAHTYSTTLVATNGQGALHWSIAPMSSTALFVNGLTMDANTGTLSGTANFSGTAGFVATVTDSASPAGSATKGFTVTAYQPLTSAQSQTATIAEFTNFLNVHAGIQGGVPPVGYSVRSGNMPPGLKFDGTGQLIGSPYQTGTFQFVLAAQDSFSPPETASQPFAITVTPAGLSLMNSFPGQILANRPLSERLVAIGGVPPYTFSVGGAGTSLPSGLKLDPSTGTISGIPTMVGPYIFSASVTDSTPGTAFTTISGNIVTPLGRNDTLSTATPVSNGSYQASISPYIDPPNGVPTAGDNDYYKLVSLGGSVVHVETFAKRNNINNPLDTVIEIVDANGVRLNSCRQPGDTSTNFASNCINDDISASPHVQDSSLDISVPGPTNIANAVYVHVFDWRGDARPDMTYSLQVSGILSPMLVSTASLPGGATGIQYSMQLQTSGSFTPPLSWSASSSSPPPGITLSSSGLLSGIPTSAGTYNFTVQATDSGSPAQHATRDFSLGVEVPPSITTTSFPDAFTGVPYGPVPLKVAGGTAPFNYTFNPPQNFFLGIDQSGNLHGTQTIPGTFVFNAGVGDALGFTASKQFTIVVQPGTLTVPPTSTETVKLNAFSFFWITPSGGTPGFLCSVASGSLPPGMQFVQSPLGCEVQGTPTSTGTFTAGFNVVDSAQPPQTGSGSVTVAVTP